MYIPGQVICRFHEGAGEIEGVTCLHEIIDLYIYVVSIYMNSISRMKIYRNKHRPNCYCMNT